MTDNPASEPIESLKNRLLNCNPLASLGVEIFGEASYPHTEESEQGPRLWGIRRNCTYEVIAGMLPGTPSTFVRDADEFEAMGLASKFRQIAIKELSEILNLDPSESTIVKLDHQFDGDVEVLVSPEWNGIVPRPLEHFGIFGFQPILP